MLAGRGIGERRETVGISGVRSSAPLPGRTVPGTEIVAVARLMALRGCSFVADGEADRENYHHLRRQARRYPSCFRRGHRFDNLERWLAGP
jgi:hypothetical protein